MCSCGCARAAGLPVRFERAAGRSQRVVWKKKKLERAGERRMSIQGGIEGGLRYAVATAIVVEAANIQKTRAGRSIVTVGRL